MATLRYQDRGYIRFVSERTGETLFEIKMLGGSILIWGAHNARVSSRPRS